MSNDCPTCATSKDGTFYACRIHRQNKCRWRYCRAMGTEIRKEDGVEIHVCGAHAFEGDKQGLWR